jgi:hypothetical protein
MSGKPTVATVPPSFTVRLAAMGKGLNAPTAFNKAKSFAASTFTTVASSKPAPAMKKPVPVLLFEADTGDASKQYSFHLTFARVCQ